MPSRSTNLLAKKPHAPAPKVDKRKRDAPTPTAVVAAPPAPVAEVAAQDEEEPSKKKAKVVNSAKPADGEEESSDEDEDEEEEAVGTSSKAEGSVKASGPQLPTKEEVEGDRSLNDGCRLGEMPSPRLRPAASRAHSQPRFHCSALLYALLYLRFNPLPIASSSKPAAPTKSMKSAFPLDPTPYAAASSSSSLFASDWTPPNAQFELTQAQYAAKKKAARDGKAKKGDGRTGERWTFNKARESFLIRWCCEDDKVCSAHPAWSPSSCLEHLTSSLPTPCQLPAKYFPIALAYLTSVKAPAAREVSLVLLVVTVRLSC